MNGNLKILKFLMKRGCTYDKRRCINNIHQQSVNELNGAFNNNYVDDDMLYVLWRYVKCNDLIKKN